MKWLEKQVRDYQQYRASFSAEQLRGPAVWADPTNEGRTRLENDARALRRLSAEDERRAAVGGPVAREIRQAHMARVAPLIVDAIANYDLKNIQPGPAERATKVKPDPSFPDMSAPNRIQVIAITFSFGPKPTGALLEWQTKTKETFDFAALAAMLQ